MNAHTDVSRTTISPKPVPILIRSCFIIITIIALRNRRPLSTAVRLPQLLPLRPFPPINPRNLLTNLPDPPAVRQRHHGAFGAKAACGGLLHHDVEFLPVDELLRAPCFPGWLPAFDGEGRVPEPGLLAKQHALPEAAGASGLPDESGYLAEGYQVVAFGVVGYLVDQFDRELAEWVILYAGDSSGERLFHGFSFFREDEIADHDATNGKWLKGIDDRELARDC